MFLGNTFDSTQFPTTKLALNLAYQIVHVTKCSVKVNLRNLALNFTDYTLK